MKIKSLRSRAALFTLSSMLLLAGSFAGWAVFLATTPEQADPGARRPGKSVGSLVPDEPFLDEQGTAVRLRELLSRSSRTWLVPVFYECPGPCSLVIERVLSRIAGDSALQKELGKNLSVVFFSFDAKEKPALAELKREAALRRHPAITATQHVRFLSTAGSSAEMVCRALSFRYKWVAESSTFSHDLKAYEIDRQGIVLREIPIADFARAPAQS